MDRRDFFLHSVAAVTGAVTAGAVVGSVPKGESAAPDDELHEVARGARRIAALMRRARLKQRHALVPLPRGVRQTREPHSEEVTAFIKSFPHTWDMWDRLNALLDTGDENANPNGFRVAVVQGEAILRVRDRLVEACVAQSFEMEIAGYKVMCCSTPVLQSEVAGKLAEKGHFGATFFLNDDRTATFSLRSRGEFDVSLVAKKFGGGGHRNAAGFMVSIAQLVPQEKSS